MEQNEFLKKIQELIEYADGRDGIISEMEMMAPFAGEKLDRNQIDAIKTFLAGKGVKISGSKAEGGSAKKAAKPAKKMVSASASGARNLNSQEKKIYEAYLEELRHIVPLKEAELPDLLAKLAAGDEAARTRLTEGCLHRVVEIAAEYAGQGVGLADLVQEGNIALIMYLDGAQAESFDRGLRDNVGEAMDNAIMEATGNTSFKDRVMSLANKLLEIQEELERRRDEGEDVEITIEDLSARLRVTPEEIETVMKMSLSAADLEESGFGGE